MRWCLRFRSSTDFWTSSFATETSTHSANCAENRDSQRLVVDVPQVPPVRGDVVQTVQKNRRVSIVARLWTSLRPCSDVWEVPQKDHEQGHDDHEEWIPPHSKCRLFGSPRRPTVVGGRGLGGWRGRRESDSQVFCHKYNWFVRLSLQLIAVLPYTSFFSGRVQNNNKQQTTNNQQQTPLSVAIGWSPSGQYARSCAATGPHGPDSSEKFGDSGCGSSENRGGPAVADLHDEFMVDVKTTLRPFGVDDFLRHSCQTQVPGELITQVNQCNNNNPIRGGSVLTGEEPPLHSGELKHAFSQEGGPTQSKPSRLVSPGHHISMEHRLRRKHLQSNTDTDASNETSMKEMQQRRLF